LPKVVNIGQCYTGCSDYTATETPGIVFATCNRPTITFERVG